MCIFLPHACSEAELYVNGLSMNSFTKATGHESVKVAQYIRSRFTLRVNVNQAQKNLLAVPVFLKFNPPRANKIPVHQLMSLRVVNLYRFVAYLTKYVASYAQRYIVYSYYTQL